jgi:rubrerythrin
LRESLVHEREALNAYQELLVMVKGRSVLFEKYARRLIAEEEIHHGEVDKMLRKPRKLSENRSRAKESGFEQSHAKKTWLFASRRALS